MIKETKIGASVLLDSCADLENFLRGGPNLITYFLVEEGIEDPNITINGPSSASQRNAI